MFRSILFFLTLSLASFLRAGDTVVQFSTLDALLAGVFDGHFSCEEVLAAGDLGLGTFEAIDGEMLVVDGVLYQVLGDGTVVRPDPAYIRTPFATVIQFEPDQTFSLESVNGLHALEQKILSEMGNPNLLYALRVEGTFDLVKARSPLRQEPPYPPLEVVVSTQGEFAEKHSQGIMVGFILPQYLRGINAPGIHLHYINEDRTFGGHVLDFQLQNAKVEVDTASTLEVRLPAKSEAFRDAPLGLDRSEEMKAVEAGR